MPSLLTELLAERDEPLSGALVTLAAQRGDGLALEVLTGVGRALGAGVASLVHIFNPDVVAIGGGVTAAGHLLFAPLHESLALHLMAPFAGGVRVVPTALDEDAGLLGAGVLALEGLRTED
jgi:glucokinase